MPKEWTGNLVGLMHVHKITNKMLGDALGVTDRYVSMVLNGHRDPPDAEIRFTEAVNNLIAAQEQNTTTEVR